MKQQYILSRGDTIILIRHPEKLTGMDLYRAITKKLGHDNWSFIEQIATKIITVS